MEKIKAKVSISISYEDGLIKKSRGYSRGCELEGLIELPENISNIAVSLSRVIQDEFNELMNQPNPQTTMDKFEPQKDLQDDDENEQ